MPEAELPVLEAGLLGQRLVEQLADGDGVRLVDGVGGGEVVVLAGVDDDPGAGVHHPAEPLVDEGALRVDVAEEDPVHRVVEHHVQPLEPGQDGDLRHAQAGRVVGQPDVAAELRADVVQGGPHEPEVLLGGVRAGVAGAGGALGHVVQQRLPGRPDDGDDVGPGAGGGLGLRDVLVDVAGGHDQVDPGTARRVAVGGDELLAAPAVGVDPGDAGGRGGVRRLPRPVGVRARRAARSGRCRRRPARRGRAGRRRPGGERVPDRQRDAVLEAHLVADGVDHAVDPGHPVLGPPLPRHRVGAGEPGQPQHRPLDGDGGVPVGEVDHRLRGEGGELPRPGHQRRDRGRQRLVMRGSPIGLPSTSSSRQAGAARSLRTADRVSVGRPEGEVRRARRRPAGRRGCSARAAYQPPWVAASKASNGRRPEPSVRWSTAACTPPHGSSGVTGASLPRARATPASARSANGLQAAARDAEALDVHAGVAAPGRVEGRLDAGDHAPGRHPGDVGVVDHLQVLQPVPAGADGRRPQLGDDRADGVEHLPHRGVADAVEAGLDAGASCRRGRGRPGTPSRSAARRRCRAGRCRARSAPRCASRRRRRRTGLPRRRPGRARGRRPARRARPARPSSRAPAGRAPAASASRAARSSALDTSGPAISCRLPMPSAAAASSVARCAVRRCCGLDRPVGGLAGGVVGVEAQLPVGRVAGQVGDAGDEVEQRRGDGRRVDVDPGQVRRPVADDGVEVGAGEAPPLRPAGLVPAGAEHDAGRVRPPHGRPPRGPPRQGSSSSGGRDR